MKERSILFSGQMVRAIQDGRKTQTRRLVRLPPSIAGGDLEKALPDLLWGVTPGLHVPMPDDGRSERLRNPWMWPEPCRLWARETWAHDDEDGAIMFRADVGRCINADAWEQGRVEGVPRYRWRPSIHMPRWACRITLEITRVRVERLQEISETDAEAEGVRNSLNIPGGRFATENFAHLWWTLHGEGSWEANPWVWVVEFRRLTP